MQLRKVVASSVFSITLGATAFFCCLPASGETAGETLSRVCPTARTVDREHRRAHSLADDGEYDLAKRAATLYYDCYQTLTDDYARDLVYLQYLMVLPDSVRPSDDTHLIKVLMLASSGSNELAASTAYPDIRRQALFLRKNVRDELCGVYQSMPTCQH